MSQIVSSRRGMELMTSGRKTEVREIAEPLPLPEQTATPVPAATPAVPKENGLYGCRAGAPSGKINLCLHRAEGPLSLQEISERTGVPASRVIYHFEQWVGPDRVHGDRGIALKLRTDEYGRYYLAR